MSRFGCVGLILGLPLALAAQECAELELRRFHETGTYARAVGQLSEAGQIWLA